MRTVTAIAVGLLLGTVSAQGTTCSQAVARCKAAGASKPYIEQSCNAAGASCMRTGRFRGPITNTDFPDRLIRR
jgi:hypothetical protein